MFVNPGPPGGRNQTGIFLIETDSKIPEEQKDLFGYQEYACCFPDADSSINYELDPGDDYHQKIKTVVYLCLTYKISSQHLSDLVMVFPTNLYRMARIMDMAFDYKGKFEKRRIPYENWKKYEYSRYIMDENIEKTRIGFIKMSL